MNEKGKITLLSLLVFCILVYGGFVAVKLLAANFTDSQIKKEVTDMLGIMRGGHLLESQAEDAIRNILKGKDIVFEEDAADAVEVEIDREKQQIWYYYRYEVFINLIFFKKQKIVEQEAVLELYG